MDKNTLNKLKLRVYVTTPSIWFRQLNKSSYFVLGLLTSYTIIRILEGVLIP